MLTFGCNFEGVKAEFSNYQKMTFFLNSPIPILLEITG